MMIIAAVLILAIYLACPIVGKLALLLANTILPDPVPVVDEVIMWLGLLSHLMRLLRVAEFVRDHKAASVAIGIAAVLLIIGLAVLLIHLF